MLVDEDAVEMNAKLNDATVVVTGIESLTPNPSPTGEGSIYDLEGRKVGDNSQLSTRNSQLPKGIYIVNGKKVVIK